MPSSSRTVIPIVRTQQERAAGCFLQTNLLASVPMLPEPEPPAEVPALGSAVCQAIAERYRESGAEHFGIGRERFQEIVASVVIRYAADANEKEQLELVATLRLAELALARGCSAGNEAAWEAFLSRFRAPLYEAAYRIAKDEATGRELADGLYADLYGVPNAKGFRAAKLDYYMGRGSLEGWLRTVLSQQNVNRFRAQSKEVSLDEQIEAGISFADRAVVSAEPPDDRLATALIESLAALGAEERFLLASYYLDQRTLADIGRQLHVHESTISRKLERLTGELQKRVRQRLRATGVDARRCEELLHDFDVRDLNVDVAANVRQEMPLRAFSKRMDR
jgi:RNA polymerase sigma-70 factor, ECF subfamily